MTLPRKTDASEIESFLDSLKVEPWLGSRAWWPNYIFHFTDIQNATAILNCGEIRSRTQTQQTGGIPNDGASQTVLRHTSSATLGSVRFYFRPLTPMQFKTEGIWPNSFSEAHCPVPVILLFDAKKIMTLRDTAFSDRNLSANGVTQGQTSDFLKNLPFRQIYHSEPLYGVTEEHKREVISRRQAEIIYPTSLPLAPYLRFAWCRSDAELQTLLSGLDVNSWRQFKEKIGVTTKYSLFNKNRIFVTNVELGKEKVIFKFNEVGQPKGYFRAKATFNKIGSPTTPSFFWSNDRFVADRDLVIGITNIPFKESYSVTLTLDDHTAYSSSYVALDDIF